MPIELEAKIRVDSHDPIRDRLRAVDATYIGRVLETNRIFDQDDGRLREAGCGLRVRSIVVLDGKGAPATLTYKGPRQESAYKQREELETPIGDADSAVSILHALGYRERIVFEKRRESWRLEECAVELDELPALGSFVEIEGPTENAIRKALQLLDLADHELVSQGYVGMLVDHSDEGGSGRIDFRFPPE